MGRLTDSAERRFKNMKFNLKKVATVLGTALMLGSTAGFAAAASFPAPFVQSGAANVAIVVGANAAQSDILAASSVSTKLATALAAQTATGGSANGPTSSGGDSVSLATSSQNLFFNSTLNTARTSLSKTDMPNVLADGSFQDSQGNSYTYTQTIALGSDSISYGTNTNLNDPALYINTGTSPSNPVYTYTLSFNKALNVSDSNVIGNDITILGQKYTIGSGSTSTSLVLYGQGSQTTINEGSSADVVIGGAKHTISLTSVVAGTGNQNGQAFVSVDGGAAAKVVDGGANTISGITVYGKSVVYNGKSGSTSYATLSLGSNQLTMPTSNSVEVGTDLNSIQNSKVTLTADSNGKLSTIAVAIASPDQNHPYLLAGDTITDPVFGGLSINFADVNPSLNSTSRDTTQISTSGRSLAVTATTALSQGQQTFNFLYDQRSDPNSGQPYGNLRLADLNNHTIHLAEGEAIHYNEYAIINAGDYGRIIQLTEVPTGVYGGSGSGLQFTDALTGEKVFDLTVPASGIVNSTVGGGQYNLQVINGSDNSLTGSTVNITWGTGSTNGVTGNSKIVYPKIKLTNGEWMAILGPETITSGSTYSLPGIDALTTYEAGQTWTAPVGWNTTVNSTIWAFGNANYTLTNVPAAATATATISGINVTSASGTNSSINFNSTYGGAILIQEPKKTSETGAGGTTNGDIIAVGITSTGSSGNQLGVSTPYITDQTSPLTYWTSDSYKSTAVDRYGTLVTYRSDNTHLVTINVPNQQMLADVLFTAAGVTVDSGSSSSGSATELGSIVVTDAEAASVSSENLIVIGGSCINTVAASLLGSATPLCGDAFTAAAGVQSGEALIKSFDNQNGKIALLVAGFNAQETTNAATYLINNAVNTTVNTALKVTSATQATAITA